MPVFWSTVLINGLQSGCIPLIFVVRSSGRILRFLSNIDPLAVRRALDGLDPRQALVIVVSKSFTDQETMLNAITVRDWLKKTIGSFCFR